MLPTLPPVTARTGPTISAPAPSSAPSSIARSIPRSEGAKANVPSVEMTNSTAPTATTGGAPMLCAAIPPGTAPQPKQHPAKHAARPHHQPPLPPEFVQVPPTQPAREPADARARLHHAEP